MKYSTILLASIALLVVSCNRFGNTIEDPRIEYRVWKNGQWTTDWMRAYVDYYENAVLEYCGEKVKDVFQQWALVYIDNDDIPEMVLFCPGEAYGNMVLSYYDGKVSEWASWRCNLKFIPRSGLLHNRDGSMGEYWDKVIRLKNGQFTEIYNHTDILYQSYDKINDTTGANEYYCVINGGKTMRIGFEADCQQYDDRVNKIFFAEDGAIAFDASLVSFETTIL